MTTSNEPTFIPTLSDERSGRLLGLVRDGQELLLYGGLSSGLGSSALPLDRGNPGPLRVVRLRVQDRTVLVEALARDQGVGSDSHLALGRDDAQRQAVDAAFPTSRVAVLPRVRDELATALLSRNTAVSPAGVVVDLGSLAAADVFDIAGVLNHGSRSHSGPLADAVAYTLDEARSGAACSPVQSSDTALVLAGSLTFSTQQRPPVELATILADPRTFTLEQRVVLRRVPRGFGARTYHPRSGTYAKRKRLPPQGVLGRATQLLQPAFRTDATIRFSVDPGIPEPYRQAVLEGARWWSDAFRAAGLDDAYEVDIRDSDEDPWKEGINPIWWVHRGGRGWSMGHAVCDPATAEIVRGSVRLGSQRVEQLRMLFEALLAPFGDSNEEQLLMEIDTALTARIRHLAAHEVGHALGFVHNFASTEHQTVSVMDYPHPLIRLGPDGVPTLRSAYSSGLGVWDHYIVSQNYGPTSLAEHERKANTLPFMSDEDAASPGAASPTAVPWTIPLSPELPDALAALKHLLTIRDAALARFGPGVAPPSADAGELENRYGLIHLLHRFEVVRVARLVAPAESSYGLVEDLRTHVDASHGQMGAADRQRAALQELGALVAPAVVEVTPGARRWIVPRSPRALRGTAIPEATSRLGVAPDFASHERAAVGVVASQVFDVHRLNRLDAQWHTDDPYPSVEEASSTLFMHAQSLEAREVLRRYLLHALAHSALSQSARRSVLNALAAVHDQASLASRLVEGVASGDLEALERAALPSIPPGAPL